MKKLIFIVMFVIHSINTSNINTNKKDIVNMHDAQSFQNDFDEKYFEINHDFEKLRHILLHLMKTTGKMATYCEVKEHGKIEPDPSQLINEVIPDLLIHALQIANYYHIDLGEKYAERIQSIINRSNNNKNATTRS